MRITVTTKGLHAGVHWPSIMPFDPQSADTSWLVFCVLRGYAIVEPETESERDGFDTVVAEASRSSL